MSAFHGLPLTLPEIPKLSHLAGEISNQEGTVLVMGRALGYEAVAMEGEYENLPEVLLPMLVALREGEEERYAVLFAVTDAQATVGDPKTGEVGIWPRERFASLWTGSVVQLTPVEGERHATEARLVELRDRLRQALLQVGWGPPYLRKVVLLAAWAALSCVAAAAPRSGPGEPALVWILAAACAGSLWSWLASDACGSCSYAARLAGGLPVAKTGTVLYALVLASAFAPAGPGTLVTTSVGIGAALGAHTALVRELARARVACWACAFVAACALAGAVTVIAGGGPILPLGTSALLVGATTLAVLPRARANQARAWRSTAEKLARNTLAEPREEGPARLVAFTRKGCTACAFFHAAIKPALEATFADAIVVEERDLGRANAVAPILIVLGAPATVFVGLPSGDSCARVLETMKEAVEARATGVDIGRRQEMVVRDT